MHVAHGQPRIEREPAELHLGVFAALAGRHLLGAGLRRHEQRDQTAGQEGTVKVCHSNVCCRRAPNLTIRSTPMFMTTPAARASRAKLPAQSSPTSSRINERRGMSLYSLQAIIPGVAA